jgi:uncharacterized protein (DUF433 family)
MSTATTYQYLEPHPGSHFKQLFIKGTKLRAWDIYCAAYQRGDPEEDRTPEQVAGDFGIPVQAVYEAIRYGESRPIEVDYDVRRQDLLMEAANMFHPEYKYRPQELYRPLTTEDSIRIQCQLEEEFGIL